MPRHARLSNIHGSDAISASHDLFSVLLVLNICLFLLPRNYFTFDKSRPAAGGERLMFYFCLAVIHSRRGEGGEVTWVVEMNA